MSTLPSLQPRAGGSTPAPLDLRALLAPEPLQRALEAADALRPGQSLRVLTPLLPTPLLDALRMRGMETQVSALPDGGTQVLIHFRRVDECGAQACACSGA